MNLFPALLEALPGITGMEDVHSRVGAVVNDLPSIRGAAFDAAIERPAASLIARTHPDVIVFAVHALADHFLSLKTYPRKWNIDLFRIKRCVADAVASGFQAPDHPPARGGHRVVVMIPWIPNNPNNNLLRVTAGYVAGLSRHPEVDYVAALITNENARLEGLDLGAMKRDCGYFSDTHAAVFEEFRAKDRLVLHRWIKNI